MSTELMTDMCLVATLSARGWRRLVRSCSIALFVAAAVPIARGCSPATAAPEAGCREDSPIGHILLSVTRPNACSKAVRVAP
jgi:hypothetical protein